ncbi:putative E3 ubiquitin-protein ligase XBAT35 [Papaver somniferum]|uniref:putative E3 ubiquitin-protein ligase XBAT35 n=1 Tax=Papaver somniferum TaxID=3469 RepID=UPI000E6F9E3C|nr:putative E3 ubiquitin-protein ligase XBAT35 [Papaver somniferum]
MQQQPKDMLLYQQVKKGNIEKIRALRREGVGLEWVDKQGNTPLMVACMDPKLINVVKTLIELGADVNASPPSSHGGTPIRNAALRGLDQAVRLLFTHRPHGDVVGSFNSFWDNYLMYDIVILPETVSTPINGTYSALDILRGDCRSGMLFGKSSWAVIIYCSSQSQSGATLELRIYHSAQDAQPREVISLAEAKLEKPNPYHAQPSVGIVGKSSDILEAWLLNCVARSRSSSAHAGAHPPQPNSLPQVPANPPSLTSEDEDIELAMALSASLQLQYILDSNISPSSGSRMWECLSFQKVLSESSSNPAETTSIPSEEMEDDKMSYASIIFGGHHEPTNVRPIDMSTATTADHKPAKTGAVLTDDVGDTTSCIICFDAPREGACIPCGHMVGCVSCLNEIKMKKWGCPVCRRKIDGVIRIYNV